MNLLRRSPPIFVASASFAKSTILINDLQMLSDNVIINPLEREPTTDELITLVEQSNAEILLLGRTRIDKRLFERCKNLRFVAMYGVGIDNVNMVDLSAFGIGFGWTQGINRRAVVELVLTYILGHYRNVFATLSEMREGIWHKHGGFGLDGLTIGIVGMGHVGTELTKFLAPWNIDIVYCDIVDRSGVAPSAKRVTYQDLLKVSDVISFHVPLTDLTRGMLTNIELPLIKSSALVINTSRGPVVEFDHVCDAVIKGNIGGFAADVFDTEPVNVSTHQHRCLYFTPHIGGNSNRAIMAMGQSAIKHISDYIRAQDFHP